MQLTAWPDTAVHDVWEGGRERGVMGKGLLGAYPRSPPSTLVPATTMMLPELHATANAAGICTLLAACTLLVVAASVDLLLAAQTARRLTVVVVAAASAGCNNTGCRFATLVQCVFQH